MRRTGPARAPRWTTIFGACALLAACTTSAGDAEPPEGDGDGGLPASADCVLPTDCASGVCADGKCAPGPGEDGGGGGGGEDGGASSDCGGPDPKSPRCADGAPCNEGADCVSLSCDPGTKKCVSPSYTDGVKNGDETDVDCGGAGPKCAAEKTCKVHADCASDGCSFEGKCASHPSCTKLEGGYTCGPTNVGTKQNDCCESAKVGAYTVDKYLVTAGRMRTFLDRLGGDVRTWAMTLPAGKWNQSYTAGLPSSWDEANTQLGPFYGKRSCETGYETGHTFWTPPSAADPEHLPQDLSKDVLDTKALNCVPWALMAAFCVWDGGHLATEAELLAAYTNAGTTAYPWGAVGTYTTAAPNDYAVQKWAYETPNVPATAHIAASGGYADAAIRIAPPGRRPLGYNKTGHADLVGDLLEWVGNADRQFIWNGSFENHAAEADGMTPAANDPLLTRTPSPSPPGITPNQPWRWGTNIGTGRPDDTTGDIKSMGYYGLGGRCARTP